MAGVLYTDKLVRDLFVASSIILPYWVTVLFKVSSEGKIEEKVLPLFSDTS